MTLERNDVTRREMIFFYVEYDRRKKQPELPLPDMEGWRFQGSPRRYVSWFSAASWLSGFPKGPQTGGR